MISNFLDEHIQLVDHIDASELHKKYLQLCGMNKDMLDSVSYAATIQQALLPQMRHFERIFNEYFVIYQPQKIIGGDFYWIAQKNEWAVFALADCTGHGVSGAMLSVLGISYLNYVVLGKNYDGLGKMLQEIDKKWIEAFHMFTEQEVNNDWMEISLAAFNSKTRELRFSGARGRIIIVNNQGIQIIKGHNYPVGGWQIEKNRLYNEHKLFLPENSMVYMASDGFQDQFGGNRNKKISIKTFYEYLTNIHSLPAEIQKTFLTTTFNDWKKNNIQTDDISVLGLRL